MGEKFNWIALKLAVFISFIFILQSVFPENFGIFVLDSSKAFLRPWTLVTYIFLHGSFSHLYANMFALAIFGSILEKAVGYKNFLKVFFLTGIFSGVFSSFFYSSLIGASGAVFGVMGTLAMLRPKMVVWAVDVPMPMIISIIIYAVLDFAGLFYPSDIVHIGHLSALALGIFIGVIWKKKFGLVEAKKETTSVLSEDELKKWEDDYMRKHKLL